MTDPGAPDATPGPMSAPAASRAQQPVAVITGPTTGIGLGLAHEFAKTGHALMLVARGGEGLAKVEREIAGSYSVPVHVVQADLTDRDGCDRVARAVEENGLFVDYLVNNAGFAIAGPLSESKPHELLDMLDLNMRALTDLTRRFWPGMLERRRGGILNVSSLGGYVPGPYQAAYYASKAYVISLTEAMAQEAFGSGVKISVVAPGPVATNFHSQMGAEHSLYIKFLGMMDPNAVARIAYTNFMCGQTVIIPGLANIALMPFLRIVPHFALVPFSAWLLKVRKGRS